MNAWVRFVCAKKMEFWLMSADDIWVLHVAFHNFAVAYFFGPPRMPYNTANGSKQASVVMHLLLKM